MYYLDVIPSFYKTETLKVFDLCCKYLQRRRNGVKQSLDHITLNGCRGLFVFTSACSRACIIMVVLYANPILMTHCIELALSELPHIGLTFIKLSTRPPRFFSFLLQRALLTSHLAGLNKVHLSFRQPFIQFRDILQKIFIIILD